MAHLAHYREAHPLPFVITHWINLLSMIVLIFTGFFIHFPFLPGLMGACRGAHIFFGVILLVNCLVRVIMAFFVKSAPTGGTREQVTDIKTYLPQKDNRHQFGAWIKYYLFIKKDHPLSAKLGVPQKLSYIMIPFLIVIMAYTGFAIYNPLMNVSFFAVGLDLIGGAMNMRVLHYCLMYVFIGFCFIHVYLANIEGTAASKLMFFWKEHGGLTYDPKKHNISGEDE